MTTNFQCVFHADQDYAAIYPTAELETLVAKDNALYEQRWQLPQRATPGALTDLTFLQFVKDLPPVELNKLYYPEGGILNWGYVYLLFTGTQIESIKSNPTGTIKIQSKAGDELDFALMTLAVTMPLYEVGSNTSGRITGVNNDDHTLHIALFVDDRFYIANYSDNAMLCLGSSTWDNVVDACLGTLGIYVGTYPAANSRYGVPSQYSDMIEVAEYPAANILDAALVNTGRIIIRNPNGQYSIKTLLAAYNLEEAVTYNGYYLRSGGDWSRNHRDNYLGSIPLYVNCYFPTSYICSTASGVTIASTTVGSSTTVPSTYLGSAGCSTYWSWQNQGTDPIANHLRSPLNAYNYYGLSVSKATAFTDLGLVAPSGGDGTKLFRCVSRAYIASCNCLCGSTYTPTNSTALAALALQIADDFYVRKLSSLCNETWNAIVPPSGTGLRDYLYYYGRDCWTKIRSTEANKDYEQFMQEVGSTVCYPALEYCSLTVVGSSSSDAICRSNGLTISDKSPMCRTSNISIQASSIVEVNSPGVYEIHWPVSAWGQYAASCPQPSWSFNIQLTGTTPSRTFQSIQQSHWHWTQQASTVNVVFGSGAGFGPKPTAWVPTNQCVPSPGLAGQGFAEISTLVPLQCSDLPCAITLQAATVIMSGGTQPDNWQISNSEFKLVKVSTACY